MDGFTEQIHEFIKASVASREQIIEAALLSDKSCGVLEVWEMDRVGNRLVITYSLDETIPYGTIERVIKDGKL